MKIEIPVQLQWFLFPLLRKHNLLITSLALFFAASYLLSVPQAFSQEAKDANRKGSISGRVLIEGKPAFDLEVLLTSDPYLQDTLVASVKTDDQGRYFFTNLPANHYWIKVNTHEYVEISKDDYGLKQKVTLADGEQITN